MERICKNCRYFEPIEDNSIYEKRWDGHCVINSDLIYDDDICDIGKFRPFDQEW